MTPYRFDITYLRGGIGDGAIIRCGDMEADGAWRLARRMVEDDMPDAPIEAGREGKVDWTFPSLHRFAVGAVTSREVEQNPERLHPALRAAVVALRAAKARKAITGLALALGLSLASCVPQPAWAAPPAGADPNSALAGWLRSMKDVRGLGCCDSADCRRTSIRPTDDGGAEAWIGKEEYGPHAPDAWMPIPAHEMRSREDRPANVRGAWVCFYAGKVLCADVETGI